MVKPSRFNVASSLAMSRISVPIYDQYPDTSAGESRRAIRTWPTPAVSLNITFACSPQAFMCERMRVRSPAGGLSMNDTLSRTPVEGQRRATTTAIRRSPAPRRPPPPGAMRITVRRWAAFSGLISMARRSAAASLSSGRGLGRQRMIDISSSISPVYAGNLRHNITAGLRGFGPCEMMGFGFLPDPSAAAPSRCCVCAVTKRASKAPAVPMAIIRYGRETA